MAVIPYGQQWIEDDDIEAVVAVLKSSHLTQGPKVVEFEQELAAYVGARYCVVFSNATAALHAAVGVLGIAPGRAGLTSPNTFVASANCLAYNGLVPRFADIDPKTYNVTAQTLEAAWDDLVSVVIPVHFAGQPCNMEEIGALALRRGVPVIEDAAHAIGSVYADGSRVGNCRNSAMTVFSFHPVKTLTTGEGGAVTCNDPELYRKLMTFRSHGITRDPVALKQNPGPWYYEQQSLGYNFRLTDMQCALGLSQLKKIERNRQRRRAIVQAYNEAFRNLPGLQTPFEAPGVDSCFHLYVVQIDFALLKKSRPAVMKELLDRGVGTQVLYIPVPLQPWYRETFGYGEGLVPFAEAYYERALALPLFPKMSDQDVQAVISAVSAVLA